MKICVYENLRSSVPPIFDFELLDFCSLPSFVWRSSTHISQLISQIGPNWTKLGWREQLSDITHLWRMDWDDAVLIKLNQRKKYKMASLLSEFQFKDSKVFQHGPFWSSWERTFWSSWEIAAVRYPWHGWSAVEDYPRPEAGSAPNVRQHNSGACICWSQIFIKRAKIQYMFKAPFL